MHPPLVLASSSRYRAAMLAEEGLDAAVDPPDVDERALDVHLDDLGPSGLALELARRKAASVAPRHSASFVVAGDQVGVLCLEDRPVMLVKRPDVGGAVEQLMAMSGTTHELHNGLVVLDTATGRRAEGVDVQRVTMRGFTHAEAEQYVRRFEPFDSSGSYRLEDQDEMSPLEPFVVEVRGEHDSGVRGLPLPLLRRLLGEVRQP